MSLIAKMPGPPANREQIEQFFDNLKASALESLDAGIFDVWVKMSHGYVDIDNCSGMLPDCVMTGERDFIIQFRRK